jgi:prepilin-type N-terminal cleavage/methylation domain-containing protein
MSESRRRARRASRGYTLVELMMALALLAVSVIGIISLLKVTATTNGHAKNLAMAQRIAQAWAGQLQMDSTQWVNAIPTGSFLNSNAIWQRPAYSRGFGAAFDGFGNPLPDEEVAGARFCAHVRMSWLYPNTMAVAGNGVLRAEIRVFWLRDGAAPLDTVQSMCSKTQSDDQAAKIGLTTDRYHFVYQTVGLRQHSQI